MTVGPGKYDALCTMVRGLADADGAIVIVLGGKPLGNGFSVQCDRSTLSKMPELLETMAAKIRADTEQVMQ